MLSMGAMREVEAVASILPSMRARTRSALSTAGPSVQIIFVFLIKSTVQLNVQCGMVAPVDGIGDGGHPCGIADDPDEGSGAT